MLVHLTDGQVALTLDQVTKLRSPNLDMLLSRDETTITLDCDVQSFDVCCTLAWNVGSDLSCKYEDLTEAAYMKIRTDVVILSDYLGIQTVCENNLLAIYDPYEYKNKPINKGRVNDQVFNIAVNRKLTFHLKIDDRGLGEFIARNKIPYEEISKYYHIRDWVCYHIFNDDRCDIELFASYFIPNIVKSRSEGIYAHNFRFSEMCYMLEYAKRGLVDPISVIKIATIQDDKSTDDSKIHYFKYNKDSQKPLSFDVLRKYYFSNGSGDSAYLRCNAIFVHAGISRYEVWDGNDYVATVAYDEANNNGDSSARKIQKQYPHCKKFILYAVY